GGRAGARLTAGPHHRAQHVLARGEMLAERGDRLVDAVAGVGCEEFTDPVLAVGDAHRGDWVQMACGHDASLIRTTAACAGRVQSTGSMRVLTAVLPEVFPVRAGARPPHSE